MALVANISLLLWSIGSDYLRICSRLDMYQQMGQHQTVQPLRELWLGTMLWWKTQNFLCTSQARKRLSHLLWISKYVCVLYSVYPTIVVSMRCSVQCIKNTMRYIDICNLSDEVGIFKWHTILYRNGWVFGDWVFGWLGLDSGGVIFFPGLVQGGQDEYFTIHCHWFQFYMYCISLRLEITSSN